MKLEEKLIVLRKQHGMTQNNVAENLNVSRQAISRWESGLAAPTIENLKCLSSLYSVSIDILLNEQDVLPSQIQHTMAKDPEILIVILQHKKILLLYCVLFLMEAIPGTVIMIPGYPHHDIIEKYSYMNIEPAIHYNCAPFISFTLTICCIMLFLSRIFIKQRKIKLLNKINKCVLLGVMLSMVIGTAINFFYSGLFAKFISIIMLATGTYLCYCEFMEMEKKKKGVGQSII